MTWYCVEIEESYLLGGRFHQLCRDFQRAFMAAGGPEEMALFAQTNPNENVRRVFFSPGCVRYARDLMERHQGFFCARPEEKSITLLFGISEAFNLYVKDVDTSIPQPKAA